MHLEEALNSKMDIKALIFDMDGLLFDSERIVQRSWEIAGNELGIQYMGEVIYHTLGMNRTGRNEYFRKYIREDFPFEEFLELCDVDVADRIICAVDLGINSAATISVMCSDGTILGRHFLKLPKEQDCLTHSINRIKKAQQHGNRKMPRLWAKVNGINHEISVKTAKFIMDIAVLYKSQEVQRIVTDKAHRLGMHIARICAWNTSRLAYDGSGRVLRGKQAGSSSYSVCQFQNGKVYNCDLSASYNIGARYFIREILKSLPEKERLALEAEVPQAAKRSTCTWSTLIRLNAELVPSVA